MQVRYSGTHSCSLFIRIVHCLAAGLLAMLLALPASAQDDAAPAFLNVIVIQVEGGQGPNFEAMLKEFQTARVGAGMDPVQVFAISAGSPNEYHLVSPAVSIAADQAEPPPMSQTEAVAFFNRLTPLISSVRMFYARTYPDLGVEPPAGAPQPTMLMLRKIGVAFGMADEYEDWMAEEYLPALRQTGALGHTVSRGYIGDSPLTFYHAYPVAGWEDFDADDPLRGVLNEREYEALFEAIEGVIVSHELVVGQIRADLMGQ